MGAERGEDEFLFLCCMGCHLGRKHLGKGGGKGSRAIG